MMSWPEKSPPFLDGDRFRGHVAFERRILVDVNRGLRHDLRRHSPLNLDTANRHAPETLHVCFAFHGHMFRRQPSRKFPDKVDR